MKLLILTTFIATICYANAGTAKTLRLLAALNGGVLPGVNGGMMAGGMNGGAVPGMLAAAGGLNQPAVVAGAGAGLVGQPQFVQFVPRAPSFVVPAPVPNVYAVPAGNPFPFVGGPQMAQMNPPQQPMMGFPGGVVQQQFPVQPDPLRRFRREIMRQADILKTTGDTQIPAPTETMKTTACDKEGHHED